MTAERHDALSARRVPPGAERASGVLPRDLGIRLSLVVITLVASVVSSLGAPMIGLVMRDYGIPIESAQWTVTVVFMAAALGTPVLGRLGTGKRRRQAVLVTLGLVLLGSILTVLRLDFALLVVGRALQGLGLALVPLAMSAARDTLRADRAPDFIALLSVTMVAGSGLGFPLAAVVAGAWGLHGAYAFGAAMTAAATALALTSFPESPPGRSSRLDTAGVVMLGGATLGMLWAISQGGVRGWTSPYVAGPGIAGVALLGAWALWTLRSPHPLVDLRLARRRELVAVNSTAVSAGVGVYAMLTLVMLMMQDTSWGQGRPVAVAGLALTPYAVMSVVGARAARGVRARHPGAPLLSLGCGIFAAATFIIALAHDGLPTILLAMGLAGVGSGLTFSSMAVQILPHVPPAEASSALAFNQVLRFMGFAGGSALGAALMVAFGGGGAAFRDALLVTTGIWLVSALMCWMASARTPGRRASGLRKRVDPEGRQDERGRLIGDAAQVRGDG